MPQHFDLGTCRGCVVGGMNASIIMAPSGLFESATALPTQLFIRADSRERGPGSRTSTAFPVLLTFLVILNAIAIFMRQRLQRKC